MATIHLRVEPKKFGEKFAPVFSPKTTRPMTNNFVEEVRELYGDDHYEKIGETQWRNLARRT